MNRQAEYLLDARKQTTDVILREDGKVVGKVSASSIEEAQAIIEGWMNGTYQLLID